MKTILITGASGFLGARAECFFQKNYKVVAPTRKTLDITSEKDVIDYIEAVQPQYVLHSAAISDLSTAEKNKELSDVVNRLAPLYIAKGCKAVGAKLVNLSSDQVYSGNTERIALKEDVEINPQNLYAIQKMQAEELVADILPTAVSLRLTWMYDSLCSDVLPNKGLLTLLLDLAKKGEKLRVNVNQLRSITFINDVIKNLPQCFELPGGIYNYGSENDISTLELMKLAVSLLELPPDTVQAYDGNNTNILISTEKIKSHGIFLPTAQQGLREASSDNTCSHKKAVATK